MSVQESKYVKNTSLLGNWTEDVFFYVNYENSGSD